MVKEGYKHTASGWTPEDWEVKKLGDLCSTFKSGVGITSENISNGGLYAVYGGNGLRGYTDKFTHNGEYLLIGRQGALCGNIIRINGKNYVSEHAIAVQANPCNNNTFLAYKLDYLNLNRLSESSAQPGLSVEKLVRLKISIPPLKEQISIGTVLFTWDKAIEKLQQLIAQKELCKKVLMQQLLAGKKRLPGFEEKWKYLPIKKIAQEVVLKNKEDKELIVLSCTKYDGLVSSLEYFGRKIFSNDLSPYKIVPQNTFAYATNHIEEGSIGYQENYEEALISPMYTVFETNETINDKFLFRVLKSHFYIHEYQKRMEGSIDRRGGLRWDEFSKIKVPVPSLTEQNAIENILEIADKEIGLHKQQLFQLKEQKKGLMQELLTGKIRVKI
ncbi:MAG TPA: restriction endonuclease subunit S [Parafilimonas sp.]|nr:restriction endonuclease subunit S [Parafilimonas sp.]